MKAMMISLCFLVGAVAIQAEDEIPLLTLPRGGAKYMTRELLGKTIQEILPRESIVQVIQLDDSRKLSKGRDLTDHQKRPDAILPRMYRVKLKSAKGGIDAKARLTVDLAIVTKTEIWRLQVWEAAFPRSQLSPVASLATHDRDCWFYLPKPKSEKDGVDQPATAPESKPKGNAKPKPESEGRFQ